MTEPMIELAAKPDADQNRKNPASPLRLPKASHLAMPCVLTVHITSGIRLAAQRPHRRTRLHVNQLLTCPYFATGFNRDDPTSATATDHAADASSMAI